MFTGIIQAIGTVAALRPVGGDYRLTVEAGALDLRTAALGDSIAVNGVCLTAVELSADRFSADLSIETLSRTTLQGLRTGSPVNLEKALTLATPLGGHLVSGHVDGVGELLSLAPAGRSRLLRLRAPRELARYIAAKGSITVEGVSLTVNRVEGAEFELNIVPHTLTATTLGGWQPGQPVNLEVDLLARYLERLLLGEQAAEGSAAPLTSRLLEQAGLVTPTVSG
ncbi:MAG TPA: riboflavin synthase [Pseudomonadales bacterium]|jgi:riboflavin synthase|nr:riboflavin synthase [Pseudomonadales bacterium]HMW14196.1 riboflavin synthase [Pseudomonadales bacterium]HMY96764.1 riboflavin synthase [Pseudomonadales bacterium]HMZ70216.1 riboflavin synthase [Pseudomonadales bacterium]HMZ91342.1 riboflavin synthase [Pseudomonadales bacterium]